MTHSAFASEQGSSQTTIKFCVPHNNVFPFFITENNRLTGISIDLMLRIFANKALLNTRLEFVKRPWKRCNADLENGLVDMMIGGYDENRQNVVYPIKLGFNMEDSMVSTANVCFSSVPGKQMRKTQNGIEHGAPFIVGIEAGFSKRHSSDINPRWVVLYNPIEKYSMLEKGRIDAIVQVCAMDTKYPIETSSQSEGFDTLEPVFPAYLSNPAYIIFSHAFANTHQVLATQIIDLSKSIDKAKIYKRYQPKLQSNASK